MTYRLAKTVRGYQPLLCLPDSLILLRRRTLYRADFDLKRFEVVAQLPRQKAIALIPSRWLARIFRLGADSAAMVDADTILIARRSTIYRVSLTTGDCVVDLQIPNGSRVLNLSLIEQGNERAVCFGEYSTRFDGGAINIWRRDDKGWAVSGTFPAGEVDHVHNICQAGGVVHVLTGDSDKASAIWRSDFDLASFTPIARGSQAVRACWLWQSPEGEKLFATDSQFETNHLRKLSGEGVAVIEGSSIYACHDAQRLIFSTSVEPGRVTGNRLRDIFERRRGPGILSNDATICVFDGGLSQVHREAKDIWPMRLAQFGTFHFPTGNPPAGRFYAYGVGVKRNDGRCMLFKA